jgi:hypothetical protein
MQGSVIRTPTRLQTVWKIQQIAALLRRSITSLTFPSGIYIVITTELFRSRATMATVRMATVRLLPAPQGTGSSTA